MFCEITCPFALDVCEMPIKVALEPVPLYDDALIRLRIVFPVTMLMLVPTTMPRVCPPIVEVLLLLRLAIVLPVMYNVPPNAPPPLMTVTLCPLLVAVLLALRLLTVVVLPMMLLATVESILLPTEMPMMPALMFAALPVVVIEPMVLL